MGSVPFVAFSWTTAARLTDLTPQSICGFFPESLIPRGVPVCTAARKSPICSGFGNFHRVICGITQLRQIIHL